MLVRGNNNFNLRISITSVVTTIGNNAPKPILRKILPLDINFSVKWFLLKESNIHGIVKMYCNRRITCTFFIRGISYEYAFDGLGIKFTSIMRMDMDIGKTPKHFRGNGGDNSSVWIKV